jgi:hypothetical protein
MCLSINGAFSSREVARQFASKPLIAKRNMRVLKVLKPNSGSAYRKFKYEKGFHYYQDGKPFSFRIERINSYWKVNIFKGLHACLTRDKVATITGPDLFTNPSYLVVRMIIPKGSKYFTNKDGEIVSDNLIWY